MVDTKDPFEVASQRPGSQRGRTGRLTRLLMNL